MPNEMSWDDAIRNVLKDSSDAMHYAEIANAVRDRELRQSYGATPAQTVNSIISMSIKEQENSPYIRISPGHYHLREVLEKQPASALRDSQKTPRPYAEVSDDKDAEGIITSFGIRWSREDVIWKAYPEIWGQQQRDADIIDFSKQIGVYLLYNHGQLVYIGKAMERGLGQRLFEHTSDRLKGRWNQFSWFGLKPITEKGNLEDIPSQYTGALVISTLEGVLIEACETGQNRRQGDGFRAIEFIQVRDSKLKAPIISALEAYLESIK